jgi:hypothetical protein
VTFGSSTRRVNRLINLLGAVNASPWGGWDVCGAMFASLDSGKYINGHTFFIARFVPNTSPFGRVEIDFNELFGDAP